jgi:hypothetical protein
MEVVEPSANAVPFSDVLAAPLAAAEVAAA